jgi:hypothetical protein
LRLWRRPSHNALNRQAQGAQNLPPLPTGPACSSGWSALPNQSLPTRIIRHALRVDHEVAVPPPRLARSP